MLCALEIARELKKHPELRVRMGIHSGPVNAVTDLNEQANIAGAGINIAQRVMDCGDAGHILLSKHVAEDLEHYPRWQPYLHDLGECEVKHGVRISVVNLYTDDAGNAALPTRLAAQKRSPAKGTQSTGFRTLLVAAMILIGLGVPALIFAPAILKSLRSPISGDKAASSSIPDKSIAVLPFENLSDDKGAAYFADGIQDEILTRLAKIGDLKVISRTSTLRYKSRPENLLEIAKQLGVAHILEGSVQKSGDRVRVNAQLINAQTDTHLWAETYDRTLTDVFAVESEVSQRVADSLRATLTGVEKATLATKPTENAAAYDAYLRGLAVVASNRESIEAFTSAADFFDTAVRLDPKFALAWARASIAHSRMYWAGYDRGPARVEKARQAAEKARELQPDAGETFLARGYYEYVVVRDYDAAWSAFKEGVLRLPNNADALVSLSFIERRKGRWAEAVAHQEQAARLDPQSVPVLSQLGITYFALKRFTDAHTIVDRLLGLAPENPQVLAGLARLDLAEGNLEAAETAMRSVPPAPSNDYVFEIQVRLALIAGRHAEAIQLIEHAFGQTPAPAGFFAGKYRYLLGFAKELAGDNAGAAPLMKQLARSWRKLSKRSPNRPRP